MLSCHDKVATVQCAPSPRRNIKKATATPTTCLSPHLIAPDLAVVCLKFTAHPQDNLTSLVPLHLLLPVHIARVVPVNAHILHRHVHHVHALVVTAVRQAAAAAIAAAVGSPAAAAAAIAATAAIAAPIAAAVGQGCVLVTHDVVSLN
jgi:hypothetical protein